jgi:hypothetical protein
MLIFFALLTCCFAGVLAHLPRNNFWNGFSQAGIIFSVLSAFGVFIALMVRIGDKNE